MNEWFPRGMAAYAIGGMLIGGGVLLLHAITGRVGGMSTLFSALWTWGPLARRPYLAQASLRASRSWRLQYALGLVLGAALWRFTLGRDVVLMPMPAGDLTLLAGGVLAGYGARLGGGCTSGHGICGLGSLQAPSLGAVLVFMATAIATANLVGGLLR